MSISKKIHIYADGPKLQVIDKIDSSTIKGYTFNPSLFRSNNVKNYLGHCQDILNKINSKPVSLEVIADDDKNIIKQAEILSDLGKNVYVKIPITNTKGEISKNIIKELSIKKVKLNITAIFTLNQVKEIIDIINLKKDILSIFSGRIFDIGIDATIHTKKINKFIKNNSKCKSLWASPRMVYDIHNAIKAQSDIITMNPQLIEKIKLFKKTPEQYSLDTVKMFFDDAKKSKFKI